MRQHHVGARLDEEDVQRQDRAGVPGVNGAAAAAERDLAKSKPVVACMPTMVAPRPTKFTASPVDSWRTTSVRGGTRSSWSTALRSLSPSLPMPRDQKVVK